MLVHLPQDIAIYVVLLAAFSVELTLQCGWKEKLAKLQQCCTVPKVEMASETIITKCTTSEANRTQASVANRTQASVANRTQVKNERKQENCITECVFAESKYVDDNGDLNVDAINQNFKQNLAGDDQWIEVFINATDTCLNNKNKKIAERLKKMAVKFKDKPNHCNPVPKQLIQCTHNMVYMNCPESARNSSAECVTLHGELDKRVNGNRGQRKGNKNERGGLADDKTATTMMDTTTEEIFRSTNVVSTILK